MDYNLHWVLNVPWLVEVEGDFLLDLLGQIEVESIVGSMWLLRLPGPNVHRPI
jgi:hypothetical protein